jgi:hypothetical protein
MPANWVVPLALSAVPPLVRQAQLLAHKVVLHWGLLLAQSGSRWVGWLVPFWVAWLEAL